MRPLDAIRSASSSVSAQIAHTATAIARLREPLRCGEAHAVVAAIGAPSGLMKSANA